MDHFSFYLTKCKLQVRYNTLQQLKCLLIVFASSKYSVNYRLHRQAFCRVQNSQRHQQHIFKRVLQEYGHQNNKNSKQRFLFQEKRGKRKVEFQIKVYQNNIQNVQKKEGSIKKIIIDQFIQANIKQNDEEHTHLLTIQRHYRVGNAIILLMLPEQYAAMQFCGQLKLQVNEKVIDNQKKKKLSLPQKEDLEDQINEQIMNMLDHKESNVNQQKLINKCTQYSIGIRQNLIFKTFFKKNKKKYKKEMFTLIDKKIQLKKMIKFNKHLFLKFKQKLKIIYKQLRICQHQIKACLIIRSESLRQGIFTDHTNLNQSYYSLVVQPCQGLPNCANQYEIENYIMQATFVFFIKIRVIQFNHQSQQIDESFLIDIFQFDQNISTFHQYLLQQQVSTLNQGYFFQSSKTRVDITNF
ncbi:hypothetical protein ABPG72_009606 [Tetrahymena utriculariae]